MTWLRRALWNEWRQYHGCKRRLKWVWWESILPFSYWYFWAVVILIGTIIVPEPDENSESWQENRIAVSCSSFDLQTSLFNKRCLFCWKNTLWISRNGCRWKDEQDSVFLSRNLLVRFSCHDSEFSSGSGMTPWNPVQNPWIFLHKILEVFLTF